MGLLDRFKSKETGKRVVLIGVDGTPCTLVRRFIEDGTMPCVAQLLPRGALLQMDTSIPDISSVAWTSFMTGKQPSKHGIFDFAAFNESTYSWSINNASHVQSRTLWQILSDKGKRVRQSRRPWDGLTTSGARNGGRRRCSS